MAMMRITSLMGPSGFPGILDPDSRYVESATGPAFGRPDEPKRNPTPGWRNTLLLRPCVLSFEPRIVGATLVVALLPRTFAVPPRGAPRRATTRVAPRRATTRVAPRGAPTAGNVGGRRLCPASPTLSLLPCARC